MSHEFTPQVLDRDAPFYVAGHRGLVGSAVWRRLKAAGFNNLIGLSSAELDLRERDEVFEFMTEVRPRYVILAAAKVGGIGANSAFPVDFLSDNLRIQTNVLDAALKVDSERVLFLGSSCIYPKYAEQPIRESSLLTGRLETTNDAYAVAKIAGIMHVQAVRRQYGLSWISAMPTNLYGPNDNFSSRNSHVLPALIRRYHDAAETGLSSVTNWGSGSPRREFLHVDDMADACLFLLENYDEDEHINIGTGSDVTVREVAELISKLVGFDGSTVWDDTKPDGTPRKLLDVSKLSQAGWHAKLDLESGLDKTISWYKHNLDLIRK